jgi:hypothetical protein
MAVIEVVERIKNIWGNLEASYTFMGKDKSKKEFLLYISGHKDGKHSLYSLKDKLLEVYSDDPETISGLLETVDKVAANWEHILSLSTIDNLNVLISNLDTKGLQSSNSFSKIGIDSLDYIDPRSVILPKKNITDSLEQNDLWVDTFSLESGGIGYSLVDSFSEETEFFLLKAGTSFDYLHTLIPKYKFLEKFISIVSEKNLYAYMGSYSAIIGSKHVKRLEGGRHLILSFGNYSVQMAVEKSIPSKQGTVCIGSVGTNNPLRAFCLL